jgi:hypothetical protein
MRRRFTYADESHSALSPLLPIEKVVERGRRTRAKENE